VATADVVAELSAQRRPEQTVIGFAAEHGAGGIERARAKLERKKLDAIVVNDVSKRGIGFETEDNEVTLISPSSELRIPKQSKEGVAAVILDHLQELRSRVPLTTDSAREEAR
jgi:phosphopantothenoylcysteine decarboxylase/phosphopantothenate--cysteine ligase